MRAGGLLEGPRRLSHGLTCSFPVHTTAADCGDYVVVTNARQVKVTGKKAEQKVYRSHSQYPGGLKEISYARMMDRKPDQVCPWRSRSRERRPVACDTWELRLLTTTFTDTFVLHTHRSS